jgi:hypothetical protein
MRSMFGRFGRWALLALAFAGGNAAATIYTWNGSAGAHWGTAANWTPNGVPASGDQVVFPSNGANRAMINDLPAGTVLSFTSNSGGGYSVSGNAVSATGQMVINAPVFNTLLVAGGSLNVQTTLNVGLDAGPHVVYLAGTLNGPLSGTGQVISWATLPGVHPFSGIFRTNNHTSSIANVVMPAATLSVFGQVYAAGAVFGPAVIPANNLHDGGYLDVRRGVLRIGGFSVESGPGIFTSPNGMRFEIAGSTPGSHGQVRVQGTVAFVATSLNVTLVAPYLPAMGQVFVLVDNDGTDPISGTFAGRPEGSTVTLGGVYPFRLSYVGGDGNDITLTSLSGAPPATVTLETGTNACQGLVVTVSPASATGTVTLYANGSTVPLGSAPIVAGKAYFTATGIADGTVLVADYNSADGANGPAASNSLVYTSTAFPPRAITDLNGDGRSDILWHNASTGMLHRMLMNGLTITSQGGVYQEPDTAWAVIGDADFNGDGVADVLWRNAVTGQVYLMVMGAGGVTGGQIIHTEPNAAWQVVATPDLDGDGKADLVWWNSTTGQQYLMLMDGVAIKQQGMGHAEPNTQWRIAASGSFYGGCREQVVWRNQQTGAVYLQRLTPSSSAPLATTFDPNVYVESDTGWRVIAARDYDGDGKADLVYRHASSGTVWAILMDGKTVKGNGGLYQVPLEWSVAAFGDYNGDGKPDLLFHNQLDGRVHMALMNGRAVTTEGTFVVVPDLSWRIMGPPEYAP